MSEEIDKKQQRFFDRTKKYYVEEDCNSDTVLMYEPPPFDEVWRFEPRIHDHHDDLRKQEHIAKEGRCRNQMRSSFKASLVLIWHLQNLTLILVLIFSLMILDTM